MSWSPCLRQQISQIMKPAPVYLTDDQKVDDIAEIISKYNLLAIPVVDKEDVITRYGCDR